jgi:putative intracellular protease/amidase
MQIKDLNIDEVDLFIIPGGVHTEISNEKILADTLKKLNEKGKIIAAICGAPLTLAKSGILDGKRYTSYRYPGLYDIFKNATYVNENLVVDGNIVTAKACGYVDMALKLGEIFNIYTDQADYQETVDYFKYFKDV